MKDAFVADSSVAIAWTVQSQGSAECDALLEEVSVGRDFVTTALWPFEAANTLLVLERRKRIESSYRKTALAALSALRPILDDEGIDRALGETTDLANRYGLTVYDAAYLEVAKRRKLPLATRAGALQDAARKCGLTLLILRQGGAIIPLLHA